MKDKVEVHDKTVPTQNALTLGLKEINNTPIRAKTGFDRQINYDTEI
jgi:hypothetical protein